MKLQPLLKNKKGQSMFDIIVFVVIITFTILAFVIIQYVFHIITLKMQDTANTIPTGLVNMSKVVEQTFTPLDNALGNLNNIAIAIAIGMLLNILVSNFLIKVHPAFFMLYIGIVILGVIISMLVSNAYENLLNTSILGTTMQTQMSAGTYLMLNLPIWVTIVGFLGAVLLFMGINRDVGAGGGFYA